LRCKFLFFFKLCPPPPLLNCFLRAWYTIYIALGCFFEHAHLRFQIVRCQFICFKRCMVSNTVYNYIYIKKALVITQTLYFALEYHRNPCTTDFSSFQWVMELIFPSFWIRTCLVINHFKNVVTEVRYTILWFGCSSGKAFGIHINGIFGPAYRTLSLIIIDTLCYMYESFPVKNALRRLVSYIYATT
jgi:hypothetical protein